MNLIDTLQATLKMDAGGLGGAGADNRKSPEEAVEMMDGMFLFFKSRNIIHNLMFFTFLPLSNF